MKDSKGKILYVGKAKNLRARVSSYFSLPCDTKTSVLLSKTAKWTYIPCSSEIEAFLMEARLIKQFQPKYNIRLKDDKSYPFLAIRKNGDFPSVEITRNKGVKDATYYGPFPNVCELRRAVKVLQKIFKFATCVLSKKHHHIRHCLLYNLNRCSAPCEMKISKRDYSDNIRAFKKFLEGGKKAVLKTLNKRMYLAAKNLDFEGAAALRDQINSLEKLPFQPIYDDFAGIDVSKALESLKELLQLSSRPKSIEAIDVSNFQGSESVGSCVSFIDGLPFKDGYRRFKIRNVSRINDIVMICEVVRRRFLRLLKENKKFPDILLVDGGLGHLNAVAEELNKFQRGSAGCVLPYLISLAKKEEKLYTRKGVLDIPQESETMRLLKYVRDEAHRFAIQYHRLLRKKVIFGKKPKCQ